MATRSGSSRSTSFFTRAATDAMPSARMAAPRSLITMRSFRSAELLVQMMFHLGLLRHDSSLPLLLERPVYWRPRHIRIPSCHQISEFDKGGLASPSSGSSASPHLVLREPSA